MFHEMPAAAARPANKAISTPRGTGPTRAQGADAQWLHLRAHQRSHFEVLVQFPQHSAMLSVLKDLRIGIACEQRPAG